MSQHVKQLLLHKELGPPVKPEGNKWERRETSGEGVVPYILATFQFPPSSSLSSSPSGLTAFFFLVSLRLDRLLLSRLPPA